MTPLVDDFMQWDFQSSSFPILNITIKIPLGIYNQSWLPSNGKAGGRPYRTPSFWLGEEEDESSQDNGPIFIM